MRAATRGRSGTNKETDRDRTTNAAQPTGRLARGRRVCGSAGPDGPAACAGGNRNDSGQRQRQLRSARSWRAGHRHQPRHAGVADRDDRRRRTICADLAACWQLQGRSDPVRLQELLADRHPSRGRSQRAHRRHDRAWQPAGSRVGHRRRPARRNQLVGAVAIGGSERGLEPAARQPRPLLAPVDHGRRDQQPELEFPGWPRAEHDDQRLSKRPGRHRQFSARRGQQHGGPAWHRQPRAKPGSGPGIPGDHERFVGGVQAAIRPASSTS